MALVQKIVPNLWFNGNADLAVEFYVYLFENSSIGDKTYYGKAGYEIHKMPEGAVLTIEFMIEGQDFVALNAGPEFKFNEAVSFMVLCDTQKEIDYYWDHLSAGGPSNAQQCGWLKDKFGLSWQIVPRRLMDMLKDKDPERVNRVMNAYLSMKKFDLVALEQAYRGNG